ncbi:hypothetical protein VU05_02215 [Desulfobulbus sp. F1]|nr:hypothetical protein [Desulfobulbus sp. F1]
MMQGHRRKNSLFIYRTVINYKPISLLETDKKPRQGWKEQFEQLQQQLSEEDQEWLDAPLIKNEVESW